MAQEFISGIQQIGIGVKNAETCLRRYADLFGMDTLVFNDVSEASLMAQYTGGKVYKRQAALSLNLQGGGGFELWQFKNRQPAEASQLPQYGDIGIYAAKLKSADVERAFRHFSLEKDLALSVIQKDPKGNPHFFVRDEYNNHFHIVTGTDWFQQKGKVVGGVTGAVIGVGDMERSLPFYQWLLNVDDAVYDTVIMQNGEAYRKVLLQKNPVGEGAFGKLLGSVEIELVQSLNRLPFKIYQDRL